MSINILWVDDEVNMLKSHILFLEKKGYTLSTINNAAEAIEMIEASHFDLILLDENMPGLSGLETLLIIKDLRPFLPVIMVTKNEEESIMEEAIGSHISDYLIKPVNPNQILLSIKKVLHSASLISNKSISSYQQEFTKINQELLSINSYSEWLSLYKRLIKWEVTLDSISDDSMKEILNNQKIEANAQFFQFMKKNYLTLIESGEFAFSHDIFKRFVIPKLAKGTPTIFLMIDNLRYDQWESLKDLFSIHYNIKETQLFSSILPTATQYSRNAIFAGLTPLEIQRQFPQYWRNDNEEGKKNDFEEELLLAQLKRNQKQDLRTAYYKISNINQENKLLANFHQFKNNELTTIVYNFIDILSHSKTDNYLIKEMIRDDKTFRSLTRNWFENSPLMKIIALAKEAKINLIITTDHGTTLVKRPTKVIGDKETSTNIRYKMGRNMKYNEKDVLAVENPEQYYLPKSNVSSRYIFAKEDLFLTYPKNYNYYVNYYRNSYQHGGISLEEMIIPIISLSPKQ